jgi:hypothetical protein
MAAPGPKARGIAVVVKPAAAASRRFLRLIFSCSMKFLMNVDMRSSLRSKLSSLASPISETGLPFALTGYILFRPGVKPVVNKVRETKLVGSIGMPL